MNTYIVLCSLLNIHHCCYVLSGEKDCNSAVHANDGAQLSRDLISPTKRYHRRTRGGWLQEMSSSQMPIQNCDW